METILGTAFGILMLAGGIAATFWTGREWNQQHEVNAKPISAAVVVLLIGFMLGSSVAPQQDCQQYKDYEQDAQTWQERTCTAANQKADDVYALALPVALLVSLVAGYANRKAKPLTLMEAMKGVAPRT